MSAPSPASEARNPGPSWGYRFLRIADRLLPEFVFKPCRAIGTVVAMAAMPEQRRHSRDYLRHVLPRRVRLLDVFRHFFAFEEALMLRLRLVNGRTIPCRYAQGSDAFSEWMDKGGPVLLGSMHVGVSDMLGCQIGGVHHRRVYIVRQRVGNSHDTDQMRVLFGLHIEFIWVNDPDQMLFSLKEAAATGDAIAMQCDRLGHSARAEAFDFLGAKRLFPFTIYHLAHIFHRSVILSVGTTEADGTSMLHASPRFEYHNGESREDGLNRARAHFQAFLAQVESLLRSRPFLWFNFVPLNPTVQTDAEPASRIE